MTRITVTVPAAVIFAVAPTVLASAHTGSDLIAVPAGSEATVTLKPAHGCGDSPTVEVRILAPVLDAIAVPVDGWTESAEPYTSPDSREVDSTVLTWTGGSLPPDETGEFPIEFVVPDAVGTLLSFPSLQECENGEELAWIEGDPDGEYPAPRLLVLHPDAEPAETLDDVPADAPGRDLLTTVVDVDNPDASTAPGDTRRRPPTSEARFGQQLGRCRHQFADRSSERARTSAGHARAVGSTSCRWW